MLAFYLFDIEFVELLDLRGWGSPPRWVVLARVACLPAERGAAAQPSAEIRDESFLTFSFRGPVLQLHNWYDLSVSLSRLAFWQNR